MTRTSWPESASELYWPSDRRLSVKLAPAFADRGVSISQRGGSPTAVISVILLSNKNNKYILFQWEYNKGNILVWRYYNYYALNIPLSNSRAWYNVLLFIHRNIKNKYTPIRGEPIKWTIPWIVLLLDWWPKCFVAACQIVGQMEVGSLAVLGPHSHYSHSNLHEWTPGLCDKKKLL
jgi:hypothetical protein